MPMLPAAPVRFSTITGSAHISESRAPTSRGSASAGPPGLNGTMILTGRVGYVWPTACAAAKSRTTRAAHSALDRGWIKGTPVIDSLLEYLCRFHGPGVHDIENREQHFIMYFDIQLWQMTRGLRGRIVLAVVLGLFALAAGIARFAFLGWFLALIFQGASFSQLAWP